MSAKSDPRTVPADAVEIQRLRQQKGWRVDDLSRHAKIDVSTIKRLEGGGRAFPFTFRKLATAFGVECARLMLHAESVERAETPTSTVRIAIKIAIPRDLFSESDDLIVFLERLHRVLPQGHNVEVDDVQEGSTLVLLRMSPQDAAFVVQAQLCGALADVPIVSISVDTPSNVLDDSVNEPADWSLSALPTQLPFSQHLQISLQAALLRGDDMTRRDAEVVVSVLPSLIKYVANPEEGHFYGLLLGMRFDGKDAPIRIRRFLNEHDPSLAHILKKLLNQCEILVEDMGQGGLPLP